MRRMTAIVSAAAFVLFAAALHAQKTSFAGTWNVDQEKTAAANPNAGGGGGGGGRGGGRGGGMAGPMTITQDDKTLTISRTMGQNEMKSTYNLDGSDSKNTGMGRGGAAGAEQISNAKWDGATLVITTKGPNGDTTAKYSMDGDDLKMETTSPGRNGGEPMTRTQYYKKGM